MIDEILLAAEQVAVRHRPRPPAVGDRLGARARFDPPARRARPRGRSGHCATPCPSAQYVAVEGAAAIVALPGATWDLIHVDGRQDADHVFRDLEAAIHHGEYVLVDHHHLDRRTFLAVSEFLHRYRAELECHWAIAGPSGHILVKPLPGLWRAGDAGADSAAIRHHYDRDYYLGDCGGYPEFLESRGRRLRRPPRRHRRPRRPALAAPRPRSRLRAGRARRPLRPARCRGHRGRLLRRRARARGRVPGRIARRGRRGRARVRRRDRGPASGGRTTPSSWPISSSTSPPTSSTRCAHRSRATSPRPGSSSCTATRTGGSTSASTRAAAPPPPSSGRTCRQSPARGTSSSCTSTS